MRTGTEVDQVTRKYETMMRDLESQTQEAIQEVQQQNTKLRYLLQTKDRQLEDQLFEYQELIIKNTELQKELKGAKDNSSLHQSSIATAVPSTKKDPDTDQNDNGEIEELRERVLELESHNLELS